MLASRLESQFSVVGAASGWLRSYLRSRQQFVRLGRHSSPMTQCDCGVPQGSVLGPLLFTAYVSAVGELIESYGMSYHQFADCDVYVGGKVRVLELMRFFYLKHSGSKINFVL